MQTARHAAAAATMVRFPSPPISVVIVIAIAIAIAPAECNERRRRGRRRGARTEGSNSDARRRGDSFTSYFRAYRGVINGIIRERARYLGARGARALRRLARYRYCARWRYAPRTSQRVQPRKRLPVGRHF